MRKHSSAFFDSARDKVSVDVKSVLSSPEFLVPMAATGAVGVAALGQAGLRKILDARKKSQAFKAMMAAHPHFKDNKDVARRFNTLYRFNPHMALDPHVAGAWIDHVAGRAEAYGGTGGPSDQGLLQSVGELSGWRNQHVSAVAREREMGKGPDIARGIATIAGHAQNAHQKLKAEHGELAVMKEHAHKLKGKLEEVATKDGFKELTGVPAGPERIRAIQVAAALHQQPGIAPLADVLMDKRKFQAFSKAMQHIDNPTVMGIAKALNEDPEGTSHAISEATGDYSGFRHRGGGRPSAHR